MTAEDPVDRLYGARPEEFTALRTELVKVARKRGDADEAKRIAAARRPTTAAWVVNTLVRSDATVRVRLAELGEWLRAAHSAMDGPRIRELSGAQRKLIDELVRAGFEVTGPTPSGTLRDDVTGTLQAAIADPEIAARLGVLTKAEQWSGFGEFGAPVEVPDEPVSGPPPPNLVVPSGPTAAEVRAARKRHAAAAADVEAARVAHVEAVEALEGRKAALKSARRRYEKLLESLAAAERELNTADAERAAAQDAEQAAGERMKVAKEELAQADSALEGLSAP